MNIKVNFTSKSGFSGFSLNEEQERELGLIYKPTFLPTQQCYEVVDKKLFFLAVIKYGIVYKEICT